MDRNLLFYRFVRGLFVILLLYGAGMMVVILTGSTFSTKMIAGFASMFSGILGMGTGYLLGRSNGTDK